MKAWRIILFVLVTLIFVMEVALYLLHVPRDYEQITPSTSFVGRDVNTNGFRGPEITNDKKALDYRVIFLGDSNTFGESVDYNDSYSAQFESLANGTNSLGKHVESVNLGVSGSNTTEEYLMLQNAYDKLKMNPDRVVVAYALNDAQAKETALADNTKTHQNLPFSARMFRSIRLFYVMNLEKEATRKTVEFYNQLYDDNNPDWQQVKKAIQDFGEFQKVTHVPVTFVIFPELLNLKDYPLNEVHEKVEAELEKNGIAYIDLLPILKEKYSGPELWADQVDHSANEIVHGTVAQVLLERFSHASR